MKRYDVYIAGGRKIKSVCSSCITNACKTFIETLDKPARYVLSGRQYASVRYNDNYSICSDFVVMES